MVGFNRLNSLLSCLPSGWLWKWQMGQHNKRMKELLKCITIAVRCSFVDRGVDGTTVLNRRELILIRIIWVNSDFYIFEIGIWHVGQESLKWRLFWYSETNLQVLLEDLGFFSRFTKPSSQRENFAESVLKGLSYERVCLKLVMSCSLVFSQSIPIPYAKPYHCHTIKKGLLHKIRKIVIIFRFIVQFG